MAKEFSAQLWVTRRGNRKAVRAKCLKSGNFEWRKLRLRRSFHINCVSFVCVCVFPTLFLDYLLNVGLYEHKNSPHVEKHHVFSWANYSFRSSHSIYREFKYIYCLNSCVMFCTWTGYPHIDLKFRVNVRWCFPPGKQVIQVNYINQSNSVSGNLLPTISSKTSITYTSLLRWKDPKANYFSLVQWKIQRHDQIRLSLLMLVMHSFIHVFQLGFLDFLVR